jgi:hypothetical protein
VFIYTRCVFAKKQEKACSFDRKVVYLKSPLREEDATAVEFRMERSWGGGKKPLCLQKYIVMFTKKLGGVSGKTLGVLSRNSGSLQRKLWEFETETLGVFLQT